MNWRNRLLLGSAASLVLVAGAQAADLPVKAKPVEYVKICSAYGAGFYYIPGTDICLRVGGFVYVETGYNGRAAVPLIYNGNLGSGNVLDRDDNRVNFRARGTVILDARSQTGIGTVRTYIAVGVDYNNLLGGFGPGAGATSGSTAGLFVTPYLERAFIQFAGFTAGYAASFFDFGAFYSIYGLASIAWNWTPLFAYTAQFGNGLSATISLEDAQTSRSLFVGPILTTGNVYGGQTAPDIVGNIRVDQAWGSAQIMGALHLVRVNQAASVAGFSDVWGWAVGGGIEIKLPMVAPGDSIMLQGVYSKGAIEYTGIASSPSGSTTNIGIVSGGVGALLPVYDAILIANGTVALSTAWSANLMFRHFWQPNLRSAFWVGYNRFENTIPLGFGQLPNGKIWQAGGNIIWSPAPTLDLSLDVLWSRVTSDACVGGCAASAPPTPYTVGTVDIWSVWTRWRRNF